MTKLSQLQKLATDCADEDWDGYGAKPISIEAILRTEDFLRCLPNNIPIPEATAEPDGSISLDWVYSQSRSLSIGFGMSDYFVIVWIDGEKSGRSVIYFDGQNIPSHVIKLINVIIK